MLHAVPRGAQTLERYSGILEKERFATVLRAAERTRAERFLATDTLLRYAEIFGALEADEDGRIEPAGR